ncbi:MAG: hypothetical protein Q9195_005019 [Heterodermia aff. obscurata]
MLFLFLSFALLCSRPIRAFFLSFWFEEKKVKEHGERTTGPLAEINGGTWERMSVFDHIELGLKKNPAGLAVICTFQSANHLESWIPREEKPPQPSALWQKKVVNWPDEQPNISFGFHNNRHQNVVFWDKQQNKLTNSIKQDNVIQSTVSNKTCLTLSYIQLHRAAVNLAAGLLAIGAQPSSTMVMFIPNGSEYAVLLWTCVLLRITYASVDPISLDITGFTELKHTMRTMQPQIIVAPDALSGKALDVAVSELQLPQPIRLCLSQPRTPGWRSLADVATVGTKTPTEEAVLVEAARHDSPERIHSIMFTSGTSGRPKGCPMRVKGMSHVLHSQSWLVDAKAGAVALQQPHNSRGIAPAQTLQTWRAGGAVVMTGQNFSVSAAAAAIKQFGATFMVLTPPMVHEWATELNARPLDVRSVRKIQIGGDAVTKGVLSKCAALFPQAQICVNHGMTEGGGSFMWPFFETPVSKIPFFGEICPIGRVAPGSVIRLWDTERKRVVSKGQLGELHISCGSIIKHYLGGRSEESFYDDSKGRWFNTGDIAMVDEEGLVFILGRRKDMIKRVDVGIMPAAIESSVEAFTGAQTIVVAIPHHVVGAEPFAVLSSYNGKTGMEIKDHVRAVLGRDYALAGLASLKQLELVDFPLNQTHKIIKSEVQTAVMKYLERVSRDKQ